MKWNAGQLRAWRKATEKNNPEFFKPVFMRALSVMVWDVFAKMVSASWWLLIETLTPSNIVISLKKIYLCRWNNASVTKVPQLFFSMTMQDQIQQDIR